MIDQGAEAGLQYWNRLKEETARIIEAFNRSPYRAEVEQALGRLKTVAGDAATSARDGLAQFGKDHQKDLDSAIAGLNRLRDKLLKRGDQSGAKLLEEAIDGLQRERRR